MTLKHIDLYSGIGGFSLAAEWAGVETICFCEIDDFCQKVLHKHWPQVPLVNDVHNVKEIKEIVEQCVKKNQREEVQKEASCQSKLLLTAGFP